MSEKPKLTPEEKRQAKLDEIWAQSRRSMEMVAHLMPGPELPPPPEIADLKDREARAVRAFAEAKSWKLKHWQAVEAMICQLMWKRLLEENADNRAWYDRQIEFRREGQRRGYGLSPAYSSRWDALLREMDDADKRETEGRDLESCIGSALLFLIGTVLFFAIFGSGILIELFVN